MLLEPAPIDPRPDRTRRQAVAALIAATGILGAVIAVGLLGPNPSTAKSPAPAAPITAAAVPSEVIPSPPGAVGPAPSTATADTGQAPPWSRFGLDPTPVTSVLEARARGDDAPPNVVVVVGWLSIRPGWVTCLPSATSSAPACSKEGILAADPGPTLRWDEGRAIEVDPEAPHLRPIFPPGIEIPPPESQAATVGSPPMAGLLPVRLVVLVGHFGASSTGGCRLGFLDCSEPFIVDGIH